ncbi:TPA: hypothetical protein ACGXHM_001041 [Listeria monocytogenes]|nr:hypothetical protein [Listeria innocua]
MNEVANSASENIGFHYISCNDFVIHYQELAERAEPYINFNAPYHSYNLEKSKSPGNMTGIEQKNVFESALFSTRMLMNILESYFDFADDETDNLVNLINKRFRMMFHEQPDNEKAVKNTFENLFVANNYNKGIDYDRETGKFNFSGREYIPDFVIPKLNLCIEVKIIKEKGKRSKIIEEINADITAYSKKYERILFDIYDLGVIRDELEFKRDIEASGDVSVIIIKQ